MKLESDPKLRVLNLWGDFTNAHNGLKDGVFTPDNLHLSPAGYAGDAAQLKPLLEAMTRP